MQLQGQLLQLHSKAERVLHKIYFNMVLHVQAPVRLQPQPELRDWTCDTGDNTGTSVFLQPELGKINF